jgi:aryl-alcohol dehydrogenase-like predicted oxidoreductase
LRKKLQPAFMIVYPKELPMDYRKLGSTDLNVSAIALGTMTWGEQNTQDEAFAQIEYAKNAGINFIDTAEMYPVPPKAETYATTERYIGNWFKARGDRADWILASKIAGPGNGIDYIRDGQLKHNRTHIVQALDASLKRLQTDWIDLYQLHWPERSTNFFGQLGYTHHADEAVHPLEDTLEALDEQVKAGKIRHIGLSNETPWATMKFLQLAESRGWPRAVSIQNPYNLLNRSFEVGLAEIAIREQCGLLAYSPAGVRDALRQVQWRRPTAKRAPEPLQPLLALFQPASRGCQRALCGPGSSTWPGSGANGPGLSLPATAVRYQQYHWRHDDGAT